MPAISGQQIDAVLTVSQEPAGSGGTCNTGEQTTWNCLVAMCCLGGVYLIWICTHSDWLIPAEDLGNLSNFLLSMCSTCIAFRHDILPGVVEPNCGTPCLRTCAQPATCFQHSATAIPCRYQSPRLGHPRNAICWCSHSAGQRLVAMLRDMQTPPRNACLYCNRYLLFLPCFHGLEKGYKVHPLHRPKGLCKRLQRSHY